VVEELAGTGGDVLQERFVQGDLTIRVGGLAAGAQGERMRRVLRVAVVADHVEVGHPEVRCG